MTTQNEHLHQKITMLEEEILRLRGLLGQQGVSNLVQEDYFEEQGHRSLEEHRARQEAYRLAEEDL